MRTAKSLLAEKPITLKADMVPGLPLIVGDRQRLLQVLLNIMSNACKFTKSGSIEISAKQQNDEILLTVSDTVPGIPREDWGWCLNLQTNRERYPTGWWYGFGDANHEESRRSTWQTTVVG